MAKMIGYMVTWTTYGTWLPGDARGYVDKNGQTFSGNEDVLRKNQEWQKSPTIKLNKKEKEIAQEVILAEAKKIGHEIIALAVCTNHVHILAKPHRQSIEVITGRYKSLTTRAFWKHGRKDKIWTRGFDKQYCFTMKEMAARINYVQKHND